MNATTVTTRDGREILLISETDLWNPIISGARLRAFCHLHGGDHQRSLSISSEGWGYCHTCHRTVLVRERNPAVVDRLLSVRPADGSRSPAFASSHASLSSSQSPVREDETPPPSLTQRSTPPPSWQQDERELLCMLECEFRAELFRSCKARAYLRERCIPYQVAEQAGLGYVPPTLLDWPGLQSSRDILRRWVERILFPLTSSEGRGFIGRSLWRWQPGMDENRHTSLFDRQGALKRWIKTNPAGWFGYEPGRLAERLVLVEGGFDRLALLTAGLPAHTVVALVGTAARPDCLVGHTRGVVLALDGDPAGAQAMARLTQQLERAGLMVAVCPPPGDGWGKDWSERYRRIGPQSVWPLYAVLAQMRQEAS